MICTMRWRRNIAGTGGLLKLGAGTATLAGTNTYSGGTFITAESYLNHLNPEWLRYYFAAKLSNTFEDIDLNLDFELGLVAGPASAPQPLDSQSLLEQASVIEENPASHIEECLRDAAICYSEGDFVKAEELLLAMIKAQRLASNEIDLLTFALFDVYRATGQQSRFEVTAMDYAERVGRSPAEWFSIPEKLAQQQAAANTPANPPAAPPPSLHAAWHCPPTLNNIALAQLQIEMGSATTCRIDWSQIASIEANAAPTLAKVVRQWCTTPAQLAWTGADALKTSLGKHTHQAASREDEIWWRIHMDILCILRLSEDFENLALDYCVAFEVSPPNATAVQCTLVEDIQDVALDFTGIADTPAPAPVPASTTKVNASGVANCALTGDIHGDAAQALLSLRNASEKAQLLTVSCALLRRIDFTAANAIFNWTKAREADGMQVHFTQVPRLVLIFLVMLGLEKHATLSMRNQ